jgi:hypothetical protein
VKLERDLDANLQFSLLESFGVALPLVNARSPVGSVINVALTHH